MTVIRMGNCLKCIHCSGRPIRWGHPIQLDTFQSAAWTHHCSPRQRDTRLNEGSFTAAKLSQSVSMSAGRSTQADGHKAGDSPNQLHSQIRQKYLTHPIHHPARAYLLTNHQCNRLNQHASPAHQNYIFAQDFNPCNVVSTIPDSGTVHENYLYNKVSIQRGLRLGYKLPSNDGPGEKVTQNTQNNRRNKNGTDETEACIVGELPVHHIVSHVQNGKKVKYIVWLYVHGPSTDKVEPLQHILQHFIARNWTPLKRVKPPDPRNQRKGIIQDNQADQLMLHTNEN